MFAVTAAERGIEDGTFGSGGTAFGSGGGGGLGSLGDGGGGGVGASRFGVDGEPMEATTDSLDAELHALAQRIDRGKGVRTDANPSSSGAHDPSLPFRNLMERRANPSSSSSSPLVASPASAPAAPGGASVAPKSAEPTSTLEHMHQAIALAIVNESGRRLVALTVVDTPSSSSTSSSSLIRGNVPVVEVTRAQALVSQAKQDAVSALRVAANLSIKSDVSKAAEDARKNLDVSAQILYKSLEMSAFRMATEEANFISSVYETRAVAASAAWDAAQRIVRSQANAIVRVHRDVDDVGVEASDAFRELAMRAVDAWAATLPPYAASPLTGTTGTTGTVPLATAFAADPRPRAETDAVDAAAMVRAFFPPKDATPPTHQQQQQHVPTTTTTTTTTTMGSPLFAQDVSRRGGGGGGIVVSEHDATSSSPPNSSTAYGDAAEVARRFQLFWVEMEHSLATQRVWAWSTLPRTTTSERKALGDRVEYAGKKFVQKEWVRFVNAMREVWEAKVGMRDGSASMYDVQDAIRYVDRRLAELASERGNLEREIPKNAATASSPSASAIASPPSHMELVVRGAKDVATKLVRSLAAIHVAHANLWFFMNSIRSAATVGMRVDAMDRIAAAVADIAENERATLTTKADEHQTFMQSLVSADAAMREDLRRRTSTIPASYDAAIALFDQSKEQFVYAEHARALGDHVTAMDALVRKLASSRRA